MALNRKSHAKKIKAGLARAAKLGRLPGAPRRVSDDEIRKVISLGTAEAARRVGLSKAQYIARRRRIEGN